MTHDPYSNAEPSRTRGPKTYQEEVRELVGYLSDSYPPAMVAPAVAELVTASPELTCETVVNWANGQLRAAGGSVPVSDFLYHSLKKLDLLDSLGLAERADYPAAFEQVEALVRQFVPPEEIATFDQSLKVIRDVLETTRVGGVELIHRPRGGGGAGAGAEGSAGGDGEIGAGSGEEAKVFRPADRERLEQLAAARRQKLASAGGGPREVRERRRFDRILSRAARRGGAAAPALRSQVLSAAAHGATTQEDLEGRLAKLRGAGFGDVQTPQVLRALTEQVPDLHVAPRGGEEMTSPTLDAVERVVHLSRDHSEQEHNIREVVRTAVEHFNNGGLGRAMTILHLSIRLLKRSQLSEAAKKKVCEDAGRDIDLMVLNETARKGHLAEHLRTFLTFFPQFELSGLYEQLVREKDRRRRHELLSLIRIYGGAAHTLLSGILVNTAGRSEQEFPWYQRRNVLYLMRQTMPEEHSVAELEYEAIHRHTDLAEPYQVVREALTLLGRIRRPEVDRHLGQCLVDQLRAGLTKSLDEAARNDLAKLQILTLEQLLERGTPAAREIALDHILKDAQWQEAYDRLLQGQSGVDFRHDPGAMTQLVTAVRERLPRFKLGVMKSRHVDAIRSMLTALSSTPAAEVFALTDEVATRHPNPEVQEAARRVRHQLETVSREGVAKRDPQLQGDLETFGLPALLQSLESAEKTGALELRAERSIAVITLYHGQFVDARYEKLTGEAALYALFQKPMGSTFAFVSANPDLAPSKQPQSLTRLLLDAARRVDEYRRLSADLPDDARLAVVPGVQPSPPPGEDDGEMIRDVWLALKRECSPSGCEEQVEREPYRLRRLLSHWLDQGAIEVVEG